MLKVLNIMNLFVVVCTLTSLIASGSKKQEKKDTGMLIISTIHTASVQLVLTDTSMTVAGLMISWRIGQ